MRIAGNAGNDSITGDDGRDDILGGEGDDLIDGGARPDRILGEFQFNSSAVNTFPWSFSFTFIEVLYLDMVLFHLIRITPALTCCRKRPRRRSGRFRPSGAALGYACSAVSHQFLTSFALFSAGTTMFWSMFAISVSWFS